MPKPTARQSHLDVALTNVSIAYQNAEYIADQVFPIVPVVNQTDKFFKFTKNDWYRDETAVRAPGARAGRADYGITSEQYICIERAVAKQIVDEVVENSDDPLRPLVTATNYVTDQILKRREIEVIDLAFTAANWANSATPSTLWSNDTSDPLGDMETAVVTVEKAIGRRANTGMIGRGLWRYLKNHPDVIDRVKAGQTPGGPAQAMLDGIAALVGLDRVLLSRAVRDTGDEGGTASVDFIGGNHMWIGFVTSSAALDMPSAGYVFQWVSREVNRYREDQEHADVIEARMSFVPKVTASDAGYLIDTAA
jgi:hypothetical protein